MNPTSLMCHLCDPSLFTYAFCAWDSSSEKRYPFFRYVVRIRGDLHWVAYSPLTINNDRIPLLLLDLRALQDFETILAVVTSVEPLLRTH